MIVVTSITTLVHHTILVVSHQQLHVIIPWHPDMSFFHINIRCQDVISYTYSHVHSWVTYLDPMCPPHTLPKCHLDLGYNFLSGPCILKSYISQIRYITLSSRVSPSTWFNPFIHLTSKCLFWLAIKRFSRSPNMQLSKYQEHLNCSTQLKVRDAKYLEHSTIP